MTAMPDSTPAPVIAMTGIAASAIRNPARVVIEGVDWSVSPGDYWVLAGPHGAGKSDFLLMTAGLTEPEAGQYSLFGERMPIFDSARLATRLRLGMVFDGGRLLNHLTIAENVALPLRYHRNLSADEANDRVQAMLELTGLSPWADSTPGAVGRNWLKRAGLARALMLEPEVLLLDNPLTGLDPWHVAWWLGFLGQLSAGHDRFGGRPMTLIVTSDTLRAWQGRARQFAFLSERRLSVLGGWAEVERSTQPAVREMLSAGPPAASS